MFSMQAAITSFGPGMKGWAGRQISPDLSLNDISRQEASGGAITRESAGAEVHATCACVAKSPHRKGEIWASTDDGLVHVTRDDGASWQNVTPPALPELAYIGCVEISPHDPDTIYVAATRYKLADYKPYLFRSTDGGRSWQSISNSFPINGNYARGAGRSGPAGTAVRRDGDGRLFQPRRLDKVDTHAWRTSGGSRLRPQDQGRQIWSPARMAARSGYSMTSRRCVRWPTARPEHGCSAARDHPDPAAFRRTGWRANTLLLRSHLRHWRRHRHH